MTYSVQNKHKHCSEQIIWGCLAINASLQTIKSLFTAREQYEIHYSYKEKRKTTLEVILDSATLICLFDSNNNCEGVFLYPDEVADLALYIEYCNTMYAMDCMLEGWITHNCLIQINTDSKVYSLLFLPIKKESDD